MPQFNGSDRNLEILSDAISGIDLLAAAKALWARIISQGDAIEVSRRLPKNLARELAGAGFYRIFLPASYGGLDMTPQG